LGEKQLTETVVKNSKELEKADFTMKEKSILLEKSNKMLEEEIRKNSKLREESEEKSKMLAKSKAREKELKRQLFFRKKNSTYFT